MNITLIILRQQWLAWLDYLNWQFWFNEILEELEAPLYKSDCLAPSHDVG